MAPDFLARLFQQRSQTRMICFDEQIVASADADILETALYERFKTPLSPAVNSEFLRKLHFIAQDENGQWHPTVGGVLMACRHPEQHLPNAYIQAVCYRGTARNANELICTCLSRCPLAEKFTDLNRSRIMDRRGEGVPVIVSASAKLAQKRPKYSILDDSELKLTIFAVPVENPSRLRRIAATLSTMPPSTLQTLTDEGILGKIKELVRNNPKITQAQMARICGVSRTSVANWIKRSNGTIRHVGFDNGGFWQLAD